MSSLATFSCSTDAFEGPLDLLLYLVQREEVDVHRLSLASIVHQFAEALHGEEESLPAPDMEKGANSLALMGALLLFKSRHLLPSFSDEEVDLSEYEPFESASALVDYIKCKIGAQHLRKAHQQQLQRLPRGLPPLELPPPPPRPLAPASAEDLRNTFQKLMESLPQPPPSTIEREVWVVRDKIVAIQSSLKATPILSIEELFIAHRSREEYIVTFLALLELMKLGELHLGKDTETNKLYVSQRVQDEDEQPID